jgi:hypothetical protein
LETIKQSYTNTITELTQELAVLREQLDARTAHLEPSLPEVSVACSIEDVTLVCVFRMAAS